MTPIRERLARNAAARYYDDLDYVQDAYGSKVEYIGCIWREFLPGVDEDLRTLREPDEGMLDAVVGGLGMMSDDAERQHYRSCHHAMFDHLLSEATDDRPPQDPA